MYIDIDHTCTRGTTLSLTACFNAIMLTMLTKSDKFEKKFIAECIIFFFNMKKFNNQHWLCVVTSFLKFHKLYFQALKFIRHKIFGLMYGLITSLLPQLKKRTKNA